MSRLRLTGANRIWLNDVDLGACTVEISVTPADIVDAGAPLNLTSTSDVTFSGEVTLDLDRDEWAVLTEHIVFSDEPGEL